MAATRKREGRCLDASPGVKGPRSLTRPTIERSRLRLGVNLLGFGALVLQVGCDSGEMQYGESNRHYAERTACEADNRVNAAVANHLAEQGRYQEADIYVRTHPIVTCPKKPD